MGKIKSPAPVKLFIGILSSNSLFFPVIESKLLSIFGTADLKTAFISFNFTDYYTAEMGSNIKRIFLSFEKPIKPDNIADIKIRTNELEQIIAEEIKSEIARPVNLDPGYLTASKVILATTKDYAHRIYIKDGIYAEITLQYRSTNSVEKGFHPLPWTYPDYRTKEYIGFFNQMRKIFLK